jgi:hypothetical protein
MYAKSLRDNRGTKQKKIRVKMWMLHIFTLILLGGQMPPERGGVSRWRSNFASH